MDLHALFLRPRPDGTSLFDLFLTECQKWYDQPAHTFTEMRVRDNKKVRGDVFEEFCVKYLKHVRKLKQVWLLKDVPDELLTTLSLKRQDVGIDIVAESDGKYYAIQCKYKKHVSHKKNVVTWKQLSTFYALVLRTGPWAQYIVMTNCDYCRHMGKKTAKDVSICLKTLQNITTAQWVEMCELSGQPPDRLATSLPTPEQLRALRLARFAPGAPAAQLPRSAPTDAASDSAPAP
jgi:Restriction endonuclease